MKKKKMLEALDSSISDRDKLIRAVFSENEQLRKRVLSQSN